MAYFEVFLATHVGLPRKEPGLFKGRPWVVYYERANRVPGKRIVRGMIAFRLKREAVAWVFSVCPDAYSEIPF